LPETRRLRWTAEGVGETEALDFIVAGNSA
jgi:hypothetical protein